MYAKFVGTLTIMSFHASVWLHAARALLRSYGAASGHVGPKPFPGAAPRRLRFGHSSTNNRNGGQFCNQIFSINILTSIMAYVLLFFCVCNIQALREYEQLIILLSLSIGFSTLGVEWINTVYEDFLW